MKEKSFGPVRFIPGKNNGKPPHCNSLYIEGAGILIDPASDRERLIRLKQESGVNMVWLSHWHEDHQMDLDLFEDVPFWISKQDAEPLTDLDLFLDWYEMEGKYREDFRKIMIEQYHYKPRKPQGFFEDGETIELGFVTVDVIPTPGHTPGHLSFFFREPKVLFLGDYDLTKFGPWYGDKYSNIDDVINSVKKLKKMPAKVWVTSHQAGLLEEAPGELWDHYIGVIQKREEKLLSILDTPKTITQIIDAGIVYRRPGTTEASFLFNEKAIMKKHIERCLKISSIQKIGDGYVKADTRQLQI